MNKFFGKMLEKRYLVIILFVVLGAVGLVLSNFVSINYDISDYLNEDTDTKMAMEIMDEEFTQTGNLQILVKNITPSTAKSLKEEFSSVKNVLTVNFDDTDKNYYNDGKALFVLLISGDDYSQNARDVIKDVEKIVNDKNLDHFSAGGAMEKVRQNQNITRQIPFILVVSIIIAYVILIFTTKSYIEPLLFLLTAGIAIFINKGTNLIFGEISYITNSISAILQLALSLDYSIMIVHAFNHGKESGKTPLESMTEALTSGVKPISASALTTVAGLLALLFMSFRIGFDIGIVLMKGIVISAIVAFTLFPCVLVSLNKVLEKCKVKGFKKKPKFSGKNFFTSLAQKRGFIIVPIAVVLIIASAFGQSFNTYDYTDSRIDAREITDVFGNNNTLVVLYENTLEGREKEEALLQKLNTYTTSDGRQVIKSCTSAYNTVYELYDTQKVSSSFGVEEETAKQLFALYDVAVYPQNHKMTFTEFLNSSKDLINNHPDASLLEGKEGILSSINLAWEVTDFLDTPLTCSDFCEGLNKILNGSVKIDEKKVNTLYQMYFASEGETPSDGKIHGGKFVSYADKTLSENELLSVLAGPEQKAGITALNSLFTAYGCGEIDSLEVFDVVKKASNAIGGEKKIGLDLVQGVFALTAINSDEEIVSEITAKDLVYFITDNMDTNRLLNMKLSTEMKDRLIDTRKMVENAESLFSGEKHTRLLLSVDLPYESEETFKFVDFISKESKSIFGKAYVAGEIASLNDLRSTFSKDNLLISIFTVISLFIIVLITFRSISLPVILVAVIQGGIWMCLTLLALVGKPIFFISYIVSSCILMGATIDYGILMSTEYVKLRKTQDRVESLKKAISTAIPTVLSSGGVLMCCGFVISIISGQKSISTVGLLLGIGTIFSVFMIMFVLPSLLYVCDKLILKTTKQ